MRFAFMASRGQGGGRLHANSAVTHGDLFTNHRLLDLDGEEAEGLLRLAHPIKEERQVLHVVQRLHGHLPPGKQPHCGNLGSSFSLNALILSESDP